jgi:hypothetical protein
MGTIGVNGRRWRGAFFAVAFIALALKILAPPGYMLADDSAQGAFTLVVCTGHGPLQIDQKPAPAHKSNPEAPCAFAGNGAGAAPPADMAVGFAHFGHYQIAKAAVADDLAPGRGLAAPPPPSQGPPALL